MAPRRWIPVHEVYEHQFLARRQGDPVLLPPHGSGGSGLVEDAAASTRLAGLAHPRFGPDRLPGEAAQSHLVAFPELVSPALRWLLLQGNGAAHSSRAAATSPAASDRWLADLDFRIWHANPCVWLERIQIAGRSPNSCRLLYTLFVPAVLLVALLLWRKGRFAEFQYYAFLIALGFLVSYVGYLLVPARGPRFLLNHLQHIPLQGLWLFRSMQDALDRLESAHYDCFPSGHTELTILAWWGSRMVSKAVVLDLFRLHSVPHFCYSLSSIPLYGRSCWRAPWRHS